MRPTDVLADGNPLRALLGLPAGDPFAVTGVTLDSRRVHPGDLYAALPGALTHGARFTDQAIGSGAAAVLTDPTGAALIAAGVASPGAPVLVVADPRAVLGAVSAWIYGSPAEALTTTGITGTNGKTTTAHLLDAALREGGLVTGVIGTVAATVGERVLPAVRTTPEAPDLHGLLAIMRQQGATVVTMEVSSHALDLGRVDGIRYDLAAFTNLSPDHLDHHGTMAAYFEAKAALFTPDRAAAALICIDDPSGAAMLARARAAGLPSASVALSGAADWTAQDLTAGPTGTQQFTARGPNGVMVECGVGLPGRFNVANALLALAAAVHHGVEARVAAAGIAACPGVPGRMERVDLGTGILGLVDYAHTPDAVQRALAAAREVTAGGRLIAVLGCGGDRDRGKRPDMGRVAALAADVLVIADDNPRSESPGAIRAAIMAGADQVDPVDRAEVTEVADRREAIQVAADRAVPGDTVIVLGKGHEQGQEAQGVVTPFDDRVELRAALGVRP